jgi:hypothetical protein
MKIIMIVPLASVTLLKRPTWKRLSEMETLISRESICQEEQKSGRCKAHLTPAE